MRQQDWSRKALSKVKEQVSSPKAGKYKTLCMKAAGLIQKGGAIQALAFIRSRGEKNMGSQFYNDMAYIYGQKTLFEDLQKAELPQYLAMSRDLIEVAAWMRRFAQIEMKDIKEEDINEEKE